ncbi:MAG: hypothetical protein ACYTHN_21385 [Planctomycetota bacterium]|jgi:hypothetical protein
MLKFQALLICVLIAAGMVEATEIVLEDPVRLKADGAYIDTQKQVGHSGPTALDFDKDGKIDLLVGCFRGTVQFFRNEGSNAEPVYKTQGFLKVEGKPISVPNW